MTEQKERQYEGGRTVAEKGGLDEDMRDVADDLESIVARSDTSMQAKLDLVIAQQTAIRTKVDSFINNFIGHQAGAGVHKEADSVNVLASPVATDLTADVLLQVNDEYDQMLAHMAMPDTGTGVHPGGADAVNLITAIYPATTEAEAVALHNDIHAQYTKHIGNTGGAFHTNADATNTYTEGAASDWDDLITTLNGFKNTTGFNAHVILTAGPTHGASDVAHIITAPNCGVQIAAMYVELIELKDDYSLHTVSLGLHPNPGTVEATADATTEATAVALANALKATLNTNFADADVHMDADILTIAAADATEYEDLLPIVAEERADYTAHIAKTTVHNKADAGNVETVIGAGGDVSALGTGGAVTLTVTKG